MTPEHQAEALQRLIEADAVIAELAEALRAVEWTGGKLYSHYGPVMPCCPACQGIRPDYLPLGPEYLGHRHGHRHGCVLAAALAKAQPPKE